MKEGEQIASGYALAMTEKSDMQFKLSFRSEQLKAFVLLNFGG